MGEPLKIRAVVLKKTDYRDNDRILTLFSPEKGKLTVSVKGVKKQNSKLRAGSELFAFGNYILTETRGKYTVTGYDSIEPFHELRDDFDRLSAGVLLLKTAELAAAEDSEEPFLFTLLLRCLDKLREHNIPAGLTVSAFLLKFCELSGYAPRLDKCLCGSTELIAVSPENGGAICKNCIDCEHMAVSGGCLFFMRKILDYDIEKVFVLKPSEKQLKELYHASCAYTAYFFDEKLRIMDYISKYDLV